MNDKKVTTVQITDQQLDLLASLVFQQVATEISQSRIVPVLVELRESVRELNSTIAGTLELWQTSPEESP